MFNFSGSELVFLLLLALIILGPEKLPEAIRKFGQTYAEFKKVSTGFQTELKQALDEPVREMRQTAELFKQAATFDGLDPQQTVVPAPQPQTTAQSAAPDDTGAAPPLAAAGGAAAVAAAAAAEAAEDVTTAVASDAAPIAGAAEAPKKVTGETVQRMRSLDDVIVRQPFGQAMTPAPAREPAETAAAVSTTDTSATEAPLGADGAEGSDPGAPAGDASAGDTTGATGEGTTPA